MENKNVRERFIGEEDSDERLSGEKRERELTR